jgi:hypothetical protein
MKNTFKNIGLTFLLGITLTSCDSSADAVTPAVVPSTFEFLFLKTANDASNNSGTWNLKKEATAGVTFTSPVNLRTDNFSTFGSTIPTSTLVANQCSAYDNVSKRYVVSSGERVVVYNMSTFSGTPAKEFEFAVANVQAVEFANGRFFAIANNKLNEYNLTSSTPTVPLSTFNEITLASGQVSNLTQNGKYLGVISGGQLYVIDTTGSGSLVPSYPQSLGTTATYEGLEAINSPGSQFDLYVIKRTATTSEFQKIDLSSALTFVTATDVTTKYTLPASLNASTKFSSALDYTTEFYYLFSNNGLASDAFNFTTIDLTPTNPSSYSPITIFGSGNKYAFGFQLKD